MRDDRTELIRGLRADHKTVSSKYFYDRRGSELFERITELEEYYPTRTERALLERWAPRWIPSLAPRTLVELGAGSAEKTELLLEQMVDLGGGRSFLPIDVSADFLESTTQRLRGRFPTLDVLPIAADITAPLGLPQRQSPTLFAFLGGTLGNFRLAAAVRLLAHIHDVMEPGDHLLLGVDQRPGPCKSVSQLEAAYNDDDGVTAEFNLNLLRVLNHRFAGDFDPSRFEHLAFYDPGEGRIEMHLVAEAAHTVRVAGESFYFAAGERLRTEISCKYDRESLTPILEAAGLELCDWTTDSGQRFALTLSTPAAGA